MKYKCFVLVVQTFCTDSTAVLYDDKTTLIYENHLLPMTFEMSMIMPPLPLMI